MHSAGARVRHLCHCISPDVSVMEGQFWCQGIDNLLCLEGGAPQLISSLEAVAGDPSLGGTATEVSGRGGRDVTRRNRLLGRSVLQYRHLAVLRAVVKGVKSVTTDWTLARRKNGSNLEPPIGHWLF